MNLDCKKPHKWRAHQVHGAKEAVTLDKDGKEVARCVLLKLICLDCDEEIGLLYDSYRMPFISITTQER